VRSEDFTAAEENEIFSGWQQCQLVKDDRRFRDSLLH
jgi:hypothetical protein